MRELASISVVAPVLDEEDLVQGFCDRVRAALSGLEFELILVDDGSRDRTAEILAEVVRDDERVRVIRLSRNFGYQAAVSAGLDHARGDAVVTIDADLQDPPELIPELVDRWRQGSDVVYAVRRERSGESWVKLATARWFSRLFVRIAQLDIPPDAGDFRLLDRRVVDALRSMPERSRFLRGLTVWVGYTQSSVPYDRVPRQAGQTRYRWRTLFRISLDALTSFSHAPLQIATVAGFVISALAFLGIPYVVVNRLLGFYVEGVSTLLFAILFLGGIQLIFLGIIGEYISRIYDEVKQRPLYIVRERLNARPIEAGSDARTHPLSRNAPDPGSHEAELELDRGARRG
jgi:polyisoprenyl-phosphate glycosyltransferase